MTDGPADRGPEAGLAEAVREVLGVSLDGERSRALWKAFRRRMGDGERSAAEEGDGIVGRSAAIEEMRRRLVRVARVEETVLVLGENGTGKDLVARAVHRRSGRSAGPFVSQNCSAMAETLLDSALFGYVRGAFTGASADRRGLFEAADGGTLFLDEVGEMSPALQAKLLRVIEERALVPVGSVVPRRVDVRVVAATNRDLGVLVRAGRFREDLLHRLSVLTVRVPPLRERLEDLPLLVSHFLDRLAVRHGVRRRLSAGALARLSSHAWPGNVRELEHELERMWVFSGSSPEIGEEHLSEEVREASAGRSPARPGLHAAVEALERRRIEEALSRTGGNRTHAATLLGVSRRNLIRKIAKLGL
jgi:transcriptional regulator with PAS, ATPase and Fis domain